MKKLLLQVHKLAYLAPLALAARANAQVSIDFPSTFAGFSSQDIKATIQNIVRIIVGFLGILVVVAIIFGGFKMMVSRGDADEMGKGRQIVTAGVIGLIILLAAYSIAT